MYCFYYLDFTTLKKTEMNEHIRYIFWATSYDQLSERTNLLEKVYRKIGESRKSFEQWNSGKRKYSKLKLFFILEALRCFLEDDFSEVVRRGKDDYEFDQHAPRHNFLSSIKRLFA